MRRLSPAGRPQLGGGGSYCQGLLSGGGQGQVERGQALRETPRGVRIFQAPIGRQDGCRSISEELPTSDAWRQKPHQKHLLEGQDTSSENAPFSGACDPGSSPPGVHALVMLPDDEVMGFVTSCPCCPLGLQTPEPGLAVEPEPTARLPSRGQVTEGRGGPREETRPSCKGVPSGLRQ